MPALQLISLSRHRQDMVVRLGTLNAHSPNRRAIEQIAYLIQQVGKLSNDQPFLYLDDAIYIYT